MLFKTTKITIETEGLLVMRQGRTVLAWCPECKADVDSLISNEDTQIAQLLSGIGADTLHVWRTPDGATHICLASLVCLSQQTHPQQIQIPERMLPEGEEK